MKTISTASSPVIRKVNSSEVLLIKCSKKCEVGIYHSAVKRIVYKWTAFKTVANISCNEHPSKVIQGQSSMLTDRPV